MTFCSPAGAEANYIAHVKSHCAVRSYGDDDELCLSTAARQLRGGFAVHHCLETHMLCYPLSLMLTQPKQRLLALSHLRHTASYDHTVW